jgi:hypothetical protein
MLAKAGILAKVVKQQHEANLSRDTVKIRDNRNIMDVNSSRTARFRQ